MASRGILSLTLDEIIERKRSFGNNSTNRNFGRPPGNTFQPRFNKRPLSSSLSSRLSLGNGGFNTKTDFRRNGVVANQARSPGSIQRKSVYSRLTINHPRRPINQGSVQRNLKTKNADDYHPVRIHNGAVVKGLRSDRLLLQKISQHRNRTLQTKLEELRAIQAQKPKMREQRSERTERRLPSYKSSTSSKVSMDINHGLMISFANNEAVRKPKPPVMRSRRPASPPPYSSSSSASSEDSDESDAFPSTSRRVSTEPPKDPLASILRLGMERPPPPKPHRQVLDPAVQKEIAALQGYAEPHSVGPGPGVKGFKMMPSRTKSSLHERFTIEKTVND